MGIGARMMRPQTHRASAAVHRHVPNLKKIKRAREEADCLADAATAALDRMAAEISARLADANPLVYAVMNGGLILAGRILPRLPFRSKSPTCTPRATATPSRAPCSTGACVRPRTCADASVLVLDDILDEGHTLEAIIAHLKEEGAEVLSAVLVLKPHERKARPGMRADFTGLADPRPLPVGCGMDHRATGATRPASTPSRACKDKERHHAGHLQVPRERRRRDQYFLATPRRSSSGILGKDPADAKGIVTRATTPRGHRPPQAAIEEERARQAELERQRSHADEEAEGSRNTGMAALVGLAQRAWPLLAMLEESLREETPVVWGLRSPASPRGLQPRPT